MLKDIPGLEVKRAVDPRTGIGTVAYRWNGAPALHVEVSGVLASRFSGLSMIEKDLRNSARWLDKIEEMWPKDGSCDAVSPAEAIGEQTIYIKAEDRKVFDIIKALFVASLTFYAKAFTAADGRRAQMSRDWLDAQYRADHDFFMDYRHNFAAHSGDKQLELGRSFVVLTPGSNPPCFLATERLQPDGIQSEDRFAALIRHAIEKVTERYNSLGAKIAYEIVWPKGYAFWQNAAEAGRVVELELPPKSP